MKISVLFALLAMSLLFGGCESKDTKLQKALAGTWQIKATTSEGLKVDGTTTYAADGTMRALGKITFGPKTADITISGTWRVQNGYLHWTAEESNIPKLVPVGYSATDKIISVTDTDYTYVDSKTGETKVEHRVP